MPNFDERDQGGRLGEMHQIGCELMGEDFWDIERVKAAGFSFSDSDIRVLDSTIFTREQVKKHGKGRRLVAFPSYPVSKMLVYFRNCFSAKQPKDENGHFYDHRLVPDLSMKVRPGWCLVDKEPVEGSLGQPYKSQEDLLVEPARVASVRVVVQTAIIYASLFGGKWFLKNNYCVRTKNSTSTGVLHVFNFDPQNSGIRMRVCLTLPTDAYPELGILSAIWPNDAVRKDMKDQIAQERQAKGPTAKSG